MTIRNCYSKIANSHSQIQCHVQADKLGGAHTVAVVGRRTSCSWITTTALCYTVMTEAYLLAPICTAQHSNCLDLSWGLGSELELELEAGDTIYTTLTIKIQGASVTSNNERTQLFLLSYTRSTNLATLTVSAENVHPLPVDPSTSVNQSCPYFRWIATQLRHIVDANQSVKWSDPKLQLEKYALMDFLLPHNCTNFITSSEGCQKAAAKTFTQLFVTFSSFFVVHNWCWNEMRVACTTLRMSDPQYLTIRS